jgi:hypothetical protein
LLTETSQADHFLGALTELEILCNILWERGLNKGEIDEFSPSHLRNITEYRYLLKLRFDMLKKSRTLVDEACFQWAVLNALREADEETYNKAIAALWELECGMNGEYPTDFPSPDGEDITEEECELEE